MVSVKKLNFDDPFYKKGSVLVICRFHFIDFFRKYNSKNDVVFGYFISSKIQMQLQICNGLICCLETFVPILSYWSGLKCEVVEICCKNLKLLQENSCLCPFSLHCSSTFQQCSSCNTLLVFLKFCWLCIPTYNELANSGLTSSGLKGVSSKPSGNYILGPDFCFSS